jgi:hypothetical protein
VAPIRGEEERRITGDYRPWWLLTTSLVFAYSFSYGSQGCVGVEDKDLTPNSPRELKSQITVIR